MTPARRAVADALELDPETLPDPVLAVLELIEGRGFDEGDALTDRERRRLRVALAAAGVQDRHRVRFLTDGPRRGRFRGLR